MNEPIGLIDGGIGTGTDRGFGRGTDLPQRDDHVALGRDLIDRHRGRETTLTIWREGELYDLAVRLNG